jgi:hypothetical protein
MSAPPFCGRLPVRPHLRPQPQSRFGRPGIVTEADVDPGLLAAYPGVVAELNLCPTDVWRGQGRPGPGWRDWEHGHIPLDTALAMQCRGEA